MERVAPEPPRVSDIVAEAGSSNKAFYRYFAGKDDLILAVMERGVAIVVSYLQHQMAKESQPADKVARWIEGALAQVADPHLISMSRARPARCRPAPTGGQPTRTIMRPLRDLLVEPDRARWAAATSSATPRRCSSCTAATMRRYVGSAEQPGPDDIDHLVRFCLRGLGVG